MSQHSFADRWICNCYVMYLSGFAISVIFPAHRNSGESNAHSSCLQIVAAHLLHIWCCAYRRFWFVKV